VKHVAWLIAVFTLLVLVSFVNAHPGHSHRKATGSPSTIERTWTIADTGNQHCGTFVAKNNGRIQIRRADDSLINLALTDLIESDQEWVAQRIEEIRETNRLLGLFFKRQTLAAKIEDQASENREDDEVDEDDPMQNRIVASGLPLLIAELDPEKAQPADGKVPEIAKAFEAFVKTKAIQTRWDENYFYVESNGFPAHQMMVGITSWQQQVPIPQLYTGNNAWRIPLEPVPAKNPLSTKNRFLRGAIALAVNGIPIFNPLNNRGDDAFLFGELDEFGGHCGRADDYHYHIPPIHLEKIIGKGLPIAYALDGYPIYGYEEPEGEAVNGLDSFNGHTDKQGRYHYHATKKYPYLNGGFHGEVVERGDQVDPQPRAEPIRPDLRPLRDAKITDFVETKPGSYRLTYDIKGKKGSVGYTLAENGSATFTFVDPNGVTKTESYSPKRRGPGGNDRRPPRNDAPPPRRDDRSTEYAKPENSFKRASNLPQFEVKSSALDDKGFISSEYTCDGASASPPVEWKGAPAETKSFAISLWHTAPDQEKSYWLIYNIPASVTKIEKNAKTIGILGLNDKRKSAFDPMCSKGPGVKTYHITVYALSAEPKLLSNKASRANLLAAIKEITLAEGTLDFQYERKK